MIHYELERDEAGTPKRLVWSPQIQRHCEERARQFEQELIEADRQRRKPMNSLVAWAVKRGVWK